MSPCAKPARRDVAESTQLQIVALIPGIVFLNHEMGLHLLSTCLNIRCHSCYLSNITISLIVPNLYHR